MTITSIGYDGSVDEVAWAALSAFLGHEACVATSTAWKATAVVGLDRTVRIAVGSGYADGVLDTSDATADVQLATSGSTRWDTIVAHRDWAGAGGATTFTKVVGAGMALSPDLDDEPGVVADQPIALVQITSGESTPTAVIDLRRLPDGSLVSAEARAILGEGVASQIAIAVSAGFTGLATLWQQEHSAFLRLLVTKSGSNLANTTVSLCTIPAYSLPPGQWPGVLALGNIESVRMFVDGDSGVVTVPGLTISPGELLQGTFSWPIGA